MRFIHARVPFPKSAGLPRAMRHEFLESPAIFSRFVAEWQAGTLAPARWTHAAHVAVAAHVAFLDPAGEAYATMRAGILHFNQCVGVQNTETSGYHETLTRFWSGTISRFVSEGRFATSFDAACAAVQEYGNDRDFFRAHYDFDVLKDRHARFTWVPPGRGSGRQRL